MAESSTDLHRPQSLGEEIANSVSHGVGFLAALVALPVLVIGALPHGAAAVVGAVIFAVTAALLYLTSTLSHALAPNRAKRLFQIFDHGAIYLLIAGTYTPFTLGVLSGAWGWSDAPFSTCAVPSKGRAASCGPMGSTTAPTEPLRTPSGPAYTPHRDTSSSDREVSCWRDGSMPSVWWRAALP